MSNALIGFGNRANDGVLSLGSFQPTLPLTNLQDRLLGIQARSVSLNPEHTRFLFDLGKELPWRTVGLCGHNFGIDGTVKFVAGNGLFTGTGFSEEVWNTGVMEAWPPVTFMENLNFEDENVFEGQYTKEERTNYNWHFIKSAPQEIYARYLYCEINDLTNEAGYIQIGRLFVGRSWQFEINMDYGASIGWTDPTEYQESIGGVKFFDPQTPFRTAVFELSYMNENEGYGKAFDIDRLSGTHGEVIFQYNPDDTLHALRRQYLGHFKDLNPLSNPKLNLFAKSYAIEELL